MTVYVDDMNAMFRGMVMCHMISDNDAELHAMALHIGLERSWHQAPPRHDSHYDIARSKRVLAVAAGAIEITWRQAGAMNRRRKVTGVLGSPQDAVEWLRAHRGDRRFASDAC